MNALLEDYNRKHIKKNRRLLNLRDGKTYVIAAYDSSGVYTRTERYNRPQSVYLAYNEFELIGGLQFTGEKAVI